MTNYWGIVGLPLIIICSLVFWNFSMFSVYFRWHSSDLAFVCCLIFCICVLVFVIWRIFYWALVWQLRLISIAVSFSTVVAFKSKHETNSTTASLKPFISWLWKLPQPVDGFDNASAPEYIRRIISISCVNYVHGSDTNKSKSTLQRHHQLNTKSRATACENHELCHVTRTASDREQIAKY